MNIGLLTVSFRLGGCRSLKEKRQRLKGIRERYGKTTNLAVCESDFQDSHQRAEWSFIAIAAGGDVVEKLLTEVTENLQLSVDAEVVDVRRERLL